MRFVVGVAAFLSPMVLLLAVMAQTPAAEAAQAILENSASFISEATVTNR